MKSLLYKMRFKMIKILKLYQKLKVLIVMKKFKISKVVKKTKLVIKFIIYKNKKI